MLCGIIDIFLVIKDLAAFVVDAVIHQIDGLIRCFIRFDILVAFVGGKPCDGINTGLHNFGKVDLIGAVSDATAVSAADR